MKDINETIMSRKSVRTYDGRRLTDEDRAALESCIKNIGNPFGIDVDFVFLDAEEHGLSSPVLSGEKLYVAGLVDKLPYSDVAFGYSLEQLLIYAWSLGIGSVWIGGTMKRSEFESAAGLTEGRRMPCVSPLGYPASKRGIKETMMRKSIKADSRRPAEELFFDGEFGKALNESGGIATALEFVRWAPSAVNKQPWRIVREGSSYHFFEKHDKGYLSEEVGDMQKIDMGIAIYHFVRGLEEAKLSYSVEVEEPSIEAAEGIEYIATVHVK